MAISRASDSSIQDGLPKFNDIWDGTTATSAFDSLGVVVLNTATSTVTFSNIPQTYQHLQIRGIVTSTSSPNNAILTRFNGDSTSLYAQHGLEGNGVTTTAQSYNAVSTTHVSLGYTADSNYPSSFVADILDYSNTNKFKTTRTLSGNDANAGGTRYVGMLSGLWRSTNAITSMAISHGASVTFGANSIFALYGVK